MANDLNYFSSNQIKVFPCAHRHNRWDPEARLNTEANFTKFIKYGNALNTDTFIINATDTSLEVMIAGYYFNISNFNYENYSNLTLYIKLATSTVIPGTTTLILSAVEEQNNNDSTGNLDSSTEEDPSSIFYGLAYTYNSSPLTNSAYVSLQITDSNNNLKNENCLPKFIKTDTGAYFNETLSVQNLELDYSSTWVSDRIAVGDGLSKGTQDKGIYLSLKLEASDNWDNDSGRTSAVKVDDNKNLFVTIPDTARQTWRAIKLIDAQSTTAAEVISEEVNTPLTIKAGKGINITPLTAEVGSLTIATNEDTLTSVNSSGSKIAEFTSSHGVKTNLYIPTNRYGYTVAGSESTDSIITAAADSNRSYAIQQNSAEQLYVVVPWNGATTIDEISGLSSNLTNLQSQITNLQNVVQDLVTKVGDIETDLDSSILYTDSVEYPAVELQKGSSEFSSSIAMYIHDNSLQYYLEVIPGKADNSAISLESTDIIITDPNNYITATLKTSTLDKSGAACKAKYLLSATDNLPKTATTLAVSTTLNISITYHYSGSSSKSTTKTLTQKINLSTYDSTVEVTTSEFYTTEPTPGVAFEASNLISGLSTASEQDLPTIIYEEGATSQQSFLQSFYSSGLKFTWGWLTDKTVVTDITFDYQFKQGSRNTDTYTCSIDSTYDINSNSYTCDIYRLVESFNYSDLLAFAGEVQTTKIIDSSYELKNINIIISNLKFTLYNSALYTGNTYVYKYDDTFIINIVYPGGKFTSAQLGILTTAFSENYTTASGYSPSISGGNSISQIFNSYDNYEGQWNESNSTYEFSFKDTYRTIPYETIYDNDNEMSNISYIHLNYPPVAKSTSYMLVTAPSESSGGGTISGAAFEIKTKATSAANSAYKTTYTNPNWSNPENGSESGWGPIDTAISKNININASTDFKVIARYAYTPVYAKYWYSTSSISLVRGTLPMQYFYTSLDFTVDKANIPFTWYDTSNSVDPAASLRLAAAEFSAWPSLTGTSLDSQTVQPEIDDVDQHLITEWNLTFKSKELSLSTNTVTLNFISTEAAQQSIYNSYMSLAAENMVGMGYLKLALTCPNDTITKITSEYLKNQSSMVAYVVPVDSIHYLLYIPITQMFGSSSMSVESATYETTINFSSGSSWLFKICITKN